MSGTIHTRGAANTRYVIKMGGFGVPFIEFEPVIGTGETFYLGDASSTDAYTSNYDGASLNGRPTSFTRNVQVTKTTSYTISEEFLERINSSVIYPRADLAIREADVMPTAWNQAYPYIEILEIIVDLPNSILNDQIRKYKNVRFQTWTKKGGNENGSFTITGNIEFSSYTK